MKPVIRLVISMLFPLLLLGAKSDMVVSQELIADRRSNITEICRQIREVRRLAIAERLDNRDLATLEERYCATAQPPTNNILPPANATQDCIDLTIMMRLARIGEGDSNLISLVDSQQLIACQFSSEGDKLSRSYPNGQTAKFGSTWSYPNGQTAKFGSTWSYPNGQTAKFASNWHYPNGNFADFESLLAWACSILGRNKCADRLLEVQNTNDFWSELTMIELAWQAYTSQK
jgi:hypothetical protein